MYEKMKDSDSGVLDFLGTKECPFTGTEYYAFKVNPSFSGEPTQVVFFNKESRNLDWGIISE